MKVISICPCCFQLFDDKDKMNEHRIGFHDDDGKVRIFVIWGRGGRLKVSTSFTGDKARIFC